MAESITVGYRQLGPGYYHKFIVYTDGCDTSFRVYFEQGRAIKIEKLGAEEC